MTTIYNYNFIIYGTCNTLLEMYIQDLFKAMYVVLKKGNNLRFIPSIAKTMHSLL